VIEKQLTSKTSSCQTCAPETNSNWRESSSYNNIHYTHYTHTHSIHTDAIL